MPEQKRTARGALGGLLGFVGLSVAAGLLVTAAVTPALAVTGMTTNNAIGVFNSLPQFLEPGQPMERTNIYATASDGSTPLLASFFDQNREEITWDRVSPFLKDAAISTEDPRFYEHGGIDMLGTARAILKTYVVGGDTQGGSSITQQYVKNVLIQECDKTAKTTEALDICATGATTADGAEGATRKLKEMRLAIGLEKKFSKDEILLGYLNLANFGSRTYGVQAASMYYFGVNASDVTIEQAATLIAILNNPSNLRIDQPDSEANGAANGYAKTLERRNYVIDKLLQEGKITAEQHTAAIAVPITPNIVQPSTGCQTAGNAGFFCDYVTRVVQNDPTFGETPEDRSALLRRGGLDIYTTIDLDIQNAAQATIDKYIPRTGARANIGGAGVTVEPGTGRVLAMAQSKLYSPISTDNPDYSGVNYNTDYAYGGSSGFQVGSSYKIFALVEWLNQGKSLYESVDSSKRAFNNFTDSCEGNWREPRGFTPRNYDGSSPARTTPYEATKQSVNTAYIAMAHKLDLCNIRKTAEALGVHRADGNPLKESPATILGTNEIAGISMATAFAALGNDGISCSPIAIDRIVGPTGDEVPAPKSACTQAVSPEVAHTAAFAMQSVFNGGTGSPARVGGAPIFGKTGTADGGLTTGAKHSWIIGGTTNAVTALWVGNIVGGANIYNVGVNGGRTAYSAKFPMWAAITSATISKLGGDELPPPSNNLVTVRQVAIPDVVGDSVEDATATLEEAGFSVNVGPAVDSTVGAGLVAASSPTGTAASGSTITLSPSTGTAPASVPNVVGQAEKDAVKAIQEAGYGSVRIEYVPTPNGNGQVTAQNPPPGTSAPKDTEITITVQQKIN